MIMEILNFKSIGPKTPLIYRTPQLSDPSAVAFCKSHMGEANLLIIRSYANQPTKLAAAIAKADLKSRFRSSLKCSINGIELADFLFI